MNELNATDALQKRDIDDMRKDLMEGFAGIHKRQDTTNGRISKAEGNITELEKVNIERKIERKFEKLVWYLFTISITIIVGLTSYIFYHLHP